ncbi:hypothetical protein B0H11DRAFT_2145792 [Mycena galericulata]|nr:hypothetical protein B0H11DRAFT_2145792 [Mycena galericulata]
MGTPAREVGRSSIRAAPSFANGASVACTRSQRTARSWPARCSPSNTRAGCAAEMWAVHGPVSGTARQRGDEVGRLRRWLSGGLTRRVNTSAMCATPRASPSSWLGMLEKISTPPAGYRFGSGTGEADVPQCPDPLAVAAATAMSTTAGVLVDGVVEQKAGPVRGCSRNSRSRCSGGDYALPRFGWTHHVVARVPGPVRGHGDSGRERVCAGLVGKVKTV